MKKLSLVFALIASVSLPIIAADVPAAGSAAPAVSLPNQEGKTVSLDRYKGKWVVL